jgi:glycosyltransferase involved in cell wall biosynthesis
MEAEMKLSGSLQPEHRLDGVDLVMIVPTLNEALNIQTLVERIQFERASTPLDLLVVDDDSPDGTAWVVRALQSRYSWIHVLQQDRRLGLAAAYQAGLAWALERSYPYIGEMDGDLAHDPQHIGPLLDAARSGAHLAIGSRYVKDGSIIDWPVWRRLASRAMNASARSMLSLPARDVTSGFRIMTRRAAQAMIDATPVCRGHGVRVETLHAAAREGITIAEVPILFRGRRFGSSKISFATLREAIWRCLQLKFESSRQATRTSAIPIARAREKRQGLGSQTARSGHVRLDLSVVIPVRNAGAFLEECLASVVRAGPREIIVVDGMSTDDTLEVAARHPVQVLSDNGNGLPVARMIGTQAAHSRRVVLLDADVVLPDGVLESLLEEFVSGGYSALQAGLHSVSGRGYWGRALANHHRWGRSKNWFGLVATIFERDVLLQYGFDERFLSGEDIELRWRLEQLGARIGVSREHIVTHRFVEDSFEFARGQWKADGHGLGRMVTKHGIRGCWLLALPLAGGVWGITQSLFRLRPQWIPYYVCYTVFNYASMLRELLFRPRRRTRRKLAAHAEEGIREEAA